MTRSGFESGTSILLIATTIGTSAARAWLIDSFVCGITPSSAATTSTAMSVIFAPRARIAVNASWPGVSRKVSFRPSTSVWYAPMCCVMPPASVSTTAVERIASSNVVLPWSTWPMIVTTGGRAVRSASTSSTISGSSSSAACLIVTSRSTSDAISSTSSSESDWVAVRICPRPIRSLDDLRHRDAERARQVLDRHAGLDRDRAGRLRGGLRTRGRLGRPVARGARVTPAGRAAFDHDSPATAARATAARADRAIRPVRSVSHASCRLRQPFDPSV